MPPFFKKPLAINATQPQQADSPTINLFPPKLRRQITEPAKEFRVKANDGEIIIGSFDEHDESNADLERTSASTGFAKL